MHTSLTNEGIKIEGTRLSSQTMACIQFVEEKILSFGPKYGAMFEKLHALKERNLATLAWMTGCGSETIKKGAIKAVDPLKEAQNLASYEWGERLNTAVHEGIHLVRLHETFSSRYLLLRLIAQHSLGLPGVQLYFDLDTDRLDSLRGLPDLPVMSDLRFKVKDVPVTERFQMYLVDNERSTFYNLLDEWNAYMEGIEVELAYLHSEPKAVMYLHAKGTTDEGNAVLEMPIFVQGLMDVLAAGYPAQFKRLAGSDTFRGWIQKKVTKTRRLAGELDNYPSLFDKQKNLLMPFFEPALTKLEQFAGNKI